MVVSNSIVAQQLSATLVVSNSIVAHAENRHIAVPKSEAQREVQHSSYVTILLYGTLSYPNTNINADYIIYL